MYLANYIKDHRVGLGIMTIATIVIATSWVASGHQAKTEAAFSSVKIVKK